MRASSKQAVTVWLMVMCLGLMVGCAKPESGSTSAALEAEKESVQTRQVVERSRLTLESFANDPDLGQFRDLTEKAKGVFIAPEVIRGAFVFGASGGNGLFMARGTKPGEWHGPAFYTLADISWGLQAGGDVSEVVLLAMTERGVTALLTNNIKLGANAGVAAGPVGAGAAGSTAALSADILSYSRAKGLYAGLSLDGAVMKTRDNWNAAYYGQPVTPTDILVTGKVKRPADASNLIGALNKVAVAK
jgi:lipid-binding SYLF domain-containing protein